MTEDTKNNFQFLNVNGVWPEFKWQGLELRDDGALQLYSLPLLAGTPSLEPVTSGIPDGPAGIAVDSDGTIYFSDPQGDRVLRIDSCDQTLAPVPCLGGKGSRPTQFKTPRGLLIPDYRHSLFVADSGNDRLQLFDIDSWQLVDIWGNSDIGGNPQPSSEPGAFHSPWSLAADDDGNVYVVDYGNSRVQKFNRTGTLIPSFWEVINQAYVLRRPSDIAAYSDGEVRLYVIDEAWHAVFVFDSNGQPLLDPAGNFLAIGATQLKKPMGIVVTKDAIYVGDNELQQVLKFNNGSDYGFVGAAVGYRGPVAALAIDLEGNLLVHTGGSVAPVRLATTSGYLRRGVLWSHAIAAGESPVTWHRLQTPGASVASGAYLRLFVHTSDDDTAPPLVDPNGAEPFADQKWRPHSAVPDPFSGVRDLFIGGNPAKFLWVGALFSGNGQSSPVVPQLRVEFDHETYLKHLPSIYREDTPCDGAHFMIDHSLIAQKSGMPDGDCAKSLLGNLPDHQICRVTGTCCCGDFLLRFVSLLESLFAEVEVSIELLPELFDPRATPGEFLTWLAGWLALELNEDWDEQKQRQVIARAFEMYGRRGTVAGLRESLNLFAGVSAVIEEPIVNGAWWALPAEVVPCNCQKAAPSGKEKEWSGSEQSSLGVTTMLAPAHPQGAVIGATATLDHSHLITNEEFGAPLFEDLAHQFNVQVYRSQLKCAETLTKVRSIIDGEKPAHTEYHLCIIEPRMRVEFQARLGIDTVVAGPPLETRFREGMPLGEDNPLAGKSPGSIGESSRLGTTTRVG
ncbi:MAG TPA: phage tail protein I [Pyrinomonadaceae bacterium]|nr:phage tail protein I [Pyrinomonadaceae bacterium]